MRFRVGPWLYRVRVTAEKLLDERGHEADGLCCWSDRTIWIRESLSPESKLDTLMHELAHAWEQAFGVPADAEGLANRSSSFAIDIGRQLERQGGVAALWRLRSDGVVDHDIQAGAPTPLYGTDCPSCGGKIAEGEIAKNDSPPQCYPGTDRLVIDRWVECDHCGVPFYWTVAATATGQATNSLIEGPTIGRPGDVVSAN